MLSPGIDIGIDYYTCHGNTWNAPYYDIDYLIRPWPEDSGFDMGANEYGSIPLPVGVPESAVGNRQSEVLVYPNPTGGVVNCQLSTVSRQCVSLKIYNLSGKEVAVLLDQMIPGGKQTVQYDASALPAGVYFYRLMVGGQQSAVGKLLKF